MAIAGFLDHMCLDLRAFGLWLRYATLQNLIPSFPWIAPPRPPPWRNPRKGRDQILPSGNLATRNDNDNNVGSGREVIPGVRSEDIDEAVSVRSTGGSSTEVEEEEEEADPNEDAIVFG